MWVGLLLAIVGGVVAVIHAMGSSPKNMLQSGSMVEIGNKFSAMYDVAYAILLFFMAVALLGIIVFACVQFVNNFKDSPKKAVRSLIAIGLMVVLVVIAYAVASPNDVSQLLLEKNGLSLSASKWIGAACISVYVLLSKAFKK